MNTYPQTASLAPTAYWHEEWLERERQSIFRESWIYACLTDDLPKHNDYVSLTVGGLPIVIRNMQDRLVAFHNVCSHRHSQIHPIGCGNEMFRCPFHGWVFNADGVPIGIPDNDNSFGFDAALRQTHALVSVALEQCGRFIFVRTAADGPTLGDWLGVYAAKLEQISDSFPETYSIRQTEWACNWKMGLEIALEGYHAPYVHPQTFAQHVGAEEISDQVDMGRPTSGPTPAAQSDAPEPTDDFIGRVEYAEPHAASYSPLSSSSLRDMRAVARRLKLPCAPNMRGYEHFFLFPNLQIGVNDGLNVSILRYEPTSPSSTQVASRLMTGTPDDTKILGGIMWRTVMKRWDDWNESVLKEDRLACERTQIAVRYAQRRAVLGQAEERVGFFQSALSQRIVKRT